MYSIHTILFINLHYGMYTSVLHTRIIASGLFLQCCQYHKH